MKGRRRRTKVPRHLFRLLFVSHIGCPYEVSYRHKYSLHQRLCTRINTTMIPVEVKPIKSANACGE